MSLKNLETSISIEDLSKYVSIQCNNFFPFSNIHYKTLISPIKNIIDKIEFSFSHVKLSYYNIGENSFFNHLNSDHYCVFLYYLSREFYTQNNDETTASKLFLLNKSLHGIDAFYGIELPDIFIVVHPLGTVLGRAKYHNKMVFYQGTTVGATHEGVYPIFKGNNILYSNSSIIGKCIIEKNVIVAANATLLNLKVPESKTILGNYPKNKIIDTKPIINKIFNK